MSSNELNISEFINILKKYENKDERFLFICDYFRGRIYKKIICTDNELKQLEVFAKK